MGIRAGIGPRAHVRGSGGQAIRMNATRTKRNRELVCAAALVTVGMVAVTACGADGGPAQGHTAARSESTARMPESTAPPADAAPSSASPDGSPDAETSRPAARPATGGGESAAKAGMGSDCTTDDLKTALKPKGQEMNSKYFDLTLTNTTGGTCAVRGYPGLSLTDADGKRIGKPATRSGNGSVRDVVLKAGQAAHAVVQTPDRGVTDGACWHKPSRIKVYPPDNTAALTTAAPHDLEVCGNSFSVGPFTARAL